MQPNAPEPTLSQLRDDIVSLFEIDARVRNLEIGAAQSAALFNGLKDEVRAMKSDLITAIEKNAPRSPWPAVSALTAVFAVVLVVAAAVYQR